MPARSVEGDGDWFFYYGFARLMHQVWANLGLARLHGALLCGPRSSILVVGNRHEGKSTVAAGWLDQGGSVATDDTVLLDVAGPVPRAYGVLREMHIDPGLAPELSRLDGITASPPYLPGRKRVRYDWVARFPSQVNSGPIEVGALIRTRVDPARSTSSREVTDAERDEILRTAAEDGPGDPLSALRPWFNTLPAWEVTWGPDLWLMPGRHVGYLLDLISRSRRG